MTIPMELLWNYCHHTVDQEERIVHVTIEQRQLSSVFKWGIFFWKVGKRLESVS